MIATELEVLDRINEREFGFMYEGKRMIRHLTFLSNAELERYIEEHSPGDCYVSVAFYGNSFSDWRGAELFFDLDSEENLRLARADAETVYEVLQDDFALEQVSMRSSGAKGYHVIVHDNATMALDKCARQEIVNYMIVKYGVETLDAPASCDVKRLRRIAGTVNSKSGKMCYLIKRFEIKKGRRNATKKLERTW